MADDMDRHVIPSDLMYEGLWERVEWLLADAENDSRMWGVPRYQPRYTEREQSIIGLLGGALRRTTDACEFYADPDTYYAIAFVPDPPCGELMDDWSEHGERTYPVGDERPGRRAREALTSPPLPPEIEAMRASATPYLEGD